MDRKIKMLSAMIACILVLTAVMFQVNDTDAATKTLKVTVSKNALVFKDGRKAIKTVNVDAGTKIKLKRSGSRLSNMKYKTSDKTIASVMKNGVVSVK